MNPLKYSDEILNSKSDGFISLLLCYFILFFKGWIFSFSFCCLSQAMHYLSSFSLFYSLKRASDSPCSQATSSHVCCPQAESRSWCSSDNVGEQQWCCWMGERLNHTIWCCWHLFQVVLFFSVPPIRLGFQFLPLLQCFISSSVALS